MEDPAGPDRALVELVLAGNQAAFAEIVARYQRLVASVAWRYGVRRENVEDVVSDVFVKVFANLGRYRPDHPFATWFYRLAVNHVIDHGRRTAREARRAELPAETPDPGPGPAAAAERRERARRVRSALAALTPRYREVLFLVYVEGHKLEEAAQLLGLPVGTIKSRLLRGREALGRVLVQRHPGVFET